MKQKFLIILYTFFLFSACKKEEELENGIVKDFGSVSLDGCGWAVEILSNIYKPIELPIEYQVNNLNVKIKYTILNSKTNCGWAQDVYDEIEIHEIKL